MAPTSIEATLQAAGMVVHLGDGPTIPIRVRLGILLARGGILLHARRVGSRTIRIPMDDLLLLLLVLLCLGDDHKFLHLSSLPQIRPAAHFIKGGDYPPPLIRRLGFQSSFSSDDEREPSAVLLLPDDWEGDMRSVALPHRRCSLTTSCASSQSPPSPWPGFYKMDNSQ